MEKREIHLICQLHNENKTWWDSISDIDYTFEQLIELYREDYLKHLNCNMLNYDFVFILHSKLQTYFEINYGIHNCGISEDKHPKDPNIKKKVMEKKSEKKFIEDFTPWDEG